MTRVYRILPVYTAAILVGVMCVRMCVCVCERERERERENCSLNEMRLQWLWMRTSPKRPIDMEPTGAGNVIGHDVHTEA